jgi:hypothetical protein
MIEDFNADTAPNRRIESISSVRIGPARWIAHTPWNGDLGDAVFIDPEPKRPFKIRDGILSITASKEQRGKWMSGLIAAARPRSSSTMSMLRPGCWTARGLPPKTTAYVAMMRQIILPDPSCSGWLEGRWRQAQPLSRTFRWL